MRAGVTEQSITSVSHYKQVKNPNPKFVEPDDKRTLPFCRKLMDKAQGFTERFDFLMHVAFSRSLGKRQRKPAPLRCKAINALLQGMCFHYDPLAGERGRVQCSVTTLAIECDLATESNRGNLSITRVTRALESLDKDFGMISYDTEFLAELGCNAPSNIQFTPALFEALDVSMQSLEAARNSRAEWQNKQREKKGLLRLDLEELANRAFSYVRSKFREYHRERREHGLKRARAKRDAERSRKDIELLVKRELTREIADGRFPADKLAVFNEVQRRTSERTIMARGNYSRLAPPNFV
ncbi:plasmid replication initiator RepA [Symbiopectobacterium purcellii]|uniref:Replication initiation protein n=1 Tax=Symbiopectobacterium purcellii TaxID=2871826 RepID=A0ABX9AQS6_9ENTR|nr:plasmid replication initiator RepA [Symbiopectobacterium purcellii]QZN96721.1 replication initiation protein [Symbiopectobacterium purcellii]